MVSAAMAVQDQCGGTRSNTVLIPTGSGISLNSSLHTITGLQLKEQFSCGNDYSLKVRKPYTITKQRERWTEEEHKKFLEALKLYDRAWRRIEEHVGTKSAVQIRSHAQKFFSKVVRESGSSNSSSMEPIEIPPPRPKRKPMHPYPRKTVHPLNKEALIPEQPLRSSSQNISNSEQENHSPTSVLSAVESNQFGSTTSSTPNHSLSPVSCDGGVYPVDLTLSEHNSFPEENATLSPIPVSTSDEQFPKVENYKLFQKEYTLSEAGSTEETSSTRSFKLFGRTVLITECHRPSSPIIGNSRLLQSDITEEKLTQPLSWNVISAEQQSSSKECIWSHSPQGSCGVVYYMQVKNDNCNTIDTSSTIALPCWNPYGGMAIPLTPFHEQENMTTNISFNGKDVQDKETQKEGSWTGSNSGTIDESDKNAEGESQSWRFSENKQYPVPEFKSSAISTTLNLRAIREKCVKGFVPYKRYKAERDDLSSNITIEERDEQRIRLCLW